MPSSACPLPRPARFILLPYTTLFRSLWWPSSTMIMSKKVGGNFGSQRSAELASCWMLVTTKSLLTQSSRLAFGPSRTATVGPLRKLEDRKSTRLNSSHLVISYAVFCLPSTSSSSLHPPSLHDALPIFVVAFIDDDHVEEGRRELWKPAVSGARELLDVGDNEVAVDAVVEVGVRPVKDCDRGAVAKAGRSEEHTSELQSPCNLVCRLLLALYLVQLASSSFPTRRSSDLCGGLHRR